MFTKLDYTIILQALNAIQIKGSDAKVLSDLIAKAEKLMSEVKDETDS
jgi:hypothetical protein